MIKAAFVCDNTDKLLEVYGDGRFDRVLELTDCSSTIITSESFFDSKEYLRDVEVIFSTWGMPAFDEAMFEVMPELKAVFYAAGSVKGFAENMLERGIKVSSAWNANAVPVAEFTVAQIILACKRYFTNSDACRDPEMRHSNEAPVGPGGFEETVALIGCGMIAKNVIRILKEFSVKIIVVDPYLPDYEAKTLGVEKVSLEEAFERAFVVSNHLPNIPPTVGMLNGKLFESMRYGGCFINTGRGAQVVEPEMIDVLQARPDLTALLDVTFPEPPEKGSPLYTLPNVRLTSHIAGSLGNELVRMADSAIAEFKRWRDDLQLQNEVTADMLKKMA